MLRGDQALDSLSCNRVELSLAEVLRRAWRAAAFASVFKQQGYADTRHGLPLRDVRMQFSTEPFQAGGANSDH